MEGGWESERAQGCLRQNVQIRRELIAEDVDEIVAAEAG